MIDRIQTHLLTLLESDVALYAGGTDWAVGWTGVKRVDDDTEAADGYVNLFDHVMEPGSGKPAVYLGMRGMEAQDEEDFEAINSQRIQYRVLRQPLVIVAHAVKQRDAKRQRNQLAANIKAILLPKYAEAGYWYDLMLQGEKLSASASGGESEGVAAALSILSVGIRYSRSLSTLT